MIPITRKELYLNKIVGNDDYSVPEKPISEEEFFFAEILGEAVQAPEPLTRYQMYLAKIAGREIEIPYPEVRLEYFLAKAAGMDVETPTPITREEMFWADYALIVEKELSGIPPLTFNAVAGTLKNYRIYGNTVNGENVGDLITEGEHAGEYNVPVTVEGKNLWDGEIESGSWMGFNADDEPYKVDYNLRCRSSKLIAVKNSSVYTISNHEPSTNVQVLVQYRDNNKKFINEYGWADFPCTFTTPSNAAFIEFIIRKPSNLEIMPEDCGDIQLELGSTALPYEPYHAPVTTNIYLPEQIKMVGNEAEYVDYKEQKMHRVRKNLFSSRIEQGSFDGITGVPNTNPTRVRSHEDDYIFLTPGVYKISAMGVEHLVIKAYDLPDISAFNYNLSMLNWVPLSSTITINTSAYYKFVFCKTNNPIITPSDISNIMLNTGSTALPYEPYIENTDLDVTLPALPTLPGTNVLSAGTEVQPSKVYVKYKGERQ